MPAQKRGVEEEEEEEEEEELVEVDDPLEHHHSNHEQHLEEPQGIDVVYYVRGFACLSFLAYSLLFPQKFVNLNHRDFTYCTFRENFWLFISLTMFFVFSESDRSHSSSNGDSKDE